MTGDQREEFAADEAYNPEFVAALLEAARQPPEAKFDNIEDLLRYLNVEYAA